MHPYSTSESRAVAYRVIALLSVATWFVAAFLTQKYYEGLIWLLSPLPTIGFGIFYFVFDRWFWKIRVFRFQLLSGTKNLAGSYCGVLISDFEEVRKQVTLTIEQRWTRCVIFMDISDDDSTSSSMSTMAAVEKKGSRATITYAYRNKVASGVAEEDMHDHDGTAELTLRQDGKLEGGYYNSRKRRGTLKLKKVE